VAIVGLDELERAYSRAQDDTFALFLGAGVSLPDKKTTKQYPKTYRWEELLHALYRKNEARMTEPFEALRDEHKKSEDWQGLASRIAGQEPAETVAIWLDDIVYEDFGRSSRVYGLLGKPLLRSAPTLRAARGFSAKIRRKTEKDWTFERNPRIGMVATPNYDFFFGATWNRYESFPKYWKVHTPFSRRVPRPEQRVIAYIHGYLPYRQDSKRKKKIVLTRKSYAEAYAPGGFADRMLQKSVCEHQLIFLGTSFSDRPLAKMLARHRGGQEHFAIVKEGDAAAERADRLGVSVVSVPGYGKVARAHEAGWRLRAQLLHRVQGLSQGFQINLGRLGQMLAADLGYERLGLFENAVRQSAALRASKFGSNKFLGLGQFGHEHCAQMLLRAGSRGLVEEGDVRAAEV
jgi:hypothetical protein